MHEVDVYMYFELKRILSNLLLWKILYGYCRSNAGLQVNGKSYENMAYIHN